MPVVKQPSSDITGIFARHYPISGANIQACEYSYSSPYQDSSYDINTKMSSFDVELFTLVTRLYEKSTCFYYVFRNWSPNQISLLISKKRKVVLLTRRCDHIIVFYWRTSVLIGYRKTTLISSLHISTSTHWACWKSLLLILLWLVADFIATTWSGYEKDALPSLSLDNPIAKQNLVNLSLRLKGISFKDINFVSVF